MIISVIVNEVIMREDLTTTSEPIDAAYIGWSSRSLGCVAYAARIIDTRGRARHLVRRARPSSLTARCVLVTTRNRPDDRWTGQ